MAWKFNPLNLIKRVSQRIRGRGKQPPTAPPPEPTPSPVRPSPRPRSGERAPRERAIMSTIAALHATGVTDGDSHDGDAVTALQDDLGLAGAQEILSEQLESTRAYLDLARQLGRFPRVGESQPGNERWHDRDTKYAGLRRANGNNTLHIPNWYDKFFYYHGTKL